MTLLFYAALYFMASFGVATGLGKLIKYGNPEEEDNACTVPAVAGCSTTTLH